MALSPISTYSIVQSTLSDVGNVEATLQKEEGEVSSGNASPDFAGMGSQVQQYLSLDQTLSQTNQYLDDNKIVETRLSTTSNALSNVISTADNLQSLISQRLSGVGDNSAFATQLQGIYQEVAGQLNTTVDNQFLFSGSKTDSPAIDASAIPTLQKPGVPDAGYYLGSNQDLTAQPQNNSMVTYNVRGDSQGFRDLIAGIATAKLGDSTSDSTLLSQSETLVQKGLQEITNEKANLDANTGQFTTADTNLQNSQLYLKGIQESIGNTDLVAVSTQVATNQGILQAAFEVFAKISNLQLSNYLK